MKKVVIYSKDMCPYCQMAKQLMESKWVNYEIIDVSSDKSALDAVIEKTWQTTVPQIFIWDKFIWWYDDVSSLEMNWELDGLLTD